jgi:hypothetical protein
MREQHVGYLVVVGPNVGVESGFVPIGVLTDRDIVKVAAHAGSKRNSIIMLHPGGGSRDTAPMMTPSTTTNTV